MARKSSKKSVRKVAPCRRLSTIEKWNPYWYRGVQDHVPGTIRRSKGAIQRDYETYGINECVDYKKRAIPCMWMPKSQVSAYAAKCEIKGRSHMSQKALCYALRRRTNGKPFSMKCANQRMLDLVMARKRYGYHGQGYKIAGLRSVLRYGKIPIPPRASKLQLANLIVTKEAEIRGIQKAGKQALAELKDEKKQVIQEMKAAGASRPEIKEVEQKYQAEEKQVQAEVKLAEVEAKEEKKILAEEHKYAPTLPVFPPPSTMPEGRPERRTALRSIRNITPARLKQLVNFANLGFCPIDPCNQTLAIGASLETMDQKLQETKQRLKVYLITSDWDDALKEHFKDQPQFYQHIKAVENAVKETKSYIDVKDVLGELLLHLRINSLSPEQKNVLQMVAQMIFYKAFIRQCQTRMTKSLIQGMFSWNHLKNFKTQSGGGLFFDVYPDYVTQISECVVR